MDRDTYNCDAIYGTHLTARNCLRAANLLPFGDEPQVYRSGARGNFGLPWQAQRGQEWLYCGFLEFYTKTRSGNCRVIVEVAGPGVPVTQSVTLPPNQIRGLAYWMIELCVSSGGSIGGHVSSSFKVPLCLQWCRFGTYGFYHMSDVVLDPLTNLHDINTWSKIRISQLIDKTC